MYSNKVAIIKRIQYYVLRRPHWIRTPTMIWLFLWFVFFCTSQSRRAFQVCILVKFSAYNNMKARNHCEVNENFLGTFKTIILDTIGCFRHLQDALEWVWLVLTPLSMITIPPKQSFLRVFPWRMTPSNRPTLGQPLSSLPSHRPPTCLKSSWTCAPSVMKMHSRHMGGGLVSIIPSEPAQDPHYNHCWGTMH